MMIKMPRHERNVDVAALADGLAVVHGLKHGQTARVLLHLPCQRVEITRALVAAQRLPRGQRLARGGNRGIHIVDVALRTSARVSPVEGSLVVLYSPLAGLTHAPPMNSSKRR